MNKILAYTIGLIVLFQVSAFASPVITETTSSAGLKHPGCLQSAAEINALATALEQNNSTRTTYWDSMMASYRGRIDKTDWVPPTDLFGSDFASPAKYAGAGLIRYINDWIINGNTTSEANAITMLNTWAGVQSFTADPSDGYEHHRLSSMWLGYLAHAADLLISSNTSWPITEQEAFKNTVRNILLPIANDNRAAGFNANWDMGATWAVMAMAILLDDKALFDEQIAWLKDGDTNARISYYLLTTGQNQESARDQTHSNMGLTFLSLATQTAWTQGVDLYEYDNRSVAKAFEYNAAYNMGEDDLPFQVYPCAVGSNSAHDTNNVISSIGRPTYFSVYEMVYHHYKNYRGIELPYSKQMLGNHTRQEQPGANWSNHNTALYWNLDLSADAALRQAQSADATLDINTNFAGRASLRLNGGGDHYGATDGRAFSKEKGVWNDGGSNVSHSNPIADTAEEELYQTYRQGGTSGSIYYHFALPNGEYRVKLHFADPSSSQPAQRVFNVYLEGTQTLDNFDIFAVAGANTAHVYDTTTTLADGQLDVQLEAVTGRPILSAIEIEPLVPAYILTYTAGPNGTLSGTTPQPVIDGADGTAITAAPEFGYRFVDWSDGRTENPRTDLSVMSNISVTANFAAINLNKVIMIKADDFRTPTQAWIDFVAVSRNLGIKIGLGAIVTDTGASSTQQWMQDQDNALDVEFWNHGWEHSVDNILTQMPLAQEGLRAATGRTPAAFGPPYNSWNADVAAAVNAAPEIKLVFTHGPSTVESQCPEVHAVKIQSENGGVGIPDAALFKAAYPLGSTPGPLSLQLHPSGSAWVNNNSMSEYTNIVQYLLDDGYSILLPTEYLALVEPKLTLTYTAGANGTLSGITTQEVFFGTRSGTPVSAIPDSGSHFVGWSDGSTENPRIDQNVTSNISVTAIFKTNAPSTLIYLAGPGGSISGSASQTVVDGADGSPVTAIADADHYFVNWSDALTDNPRTDQFVQGDIRVTANFATNVASGSVSINFGSDRQAMSASDAAGVIPAANWNNCPGGSGTRLDLLNGEGQATTVDVTYSAATTWYVGGTATSDERMMRGYLDGGRSGALPAVTVSQVPFACYDVYVYHQVDVDGNGGSVILNGTESKFIKDAAGTFAGSTIDYIEDGPGLFFGGTLAGHYVKFTGVTGTDFSITSTRDLLRVGFTGMQIINTASSNTLTYTAGPNGTISGAAMQTVGYNAGGTPVLAIADENYRFVDWSDGRSDNPRIDLNVVTDLAVTATFASSSMIEQELVADVANSSTSGYGGSILNTVNDPFAYDSEDPSAVLPDQHWSASVGFHGSMPEGTDVVLAYSLVGGALTLPVGSIFAVDLYGRDILNDRCQDIEIKLYSGGFGGTQVASIAGVAIPEISPYHVRAELTPTAAFDTVVVIGHDTTAASGNAFTLMEVRAAVSQTPNLDSDGDGLTDAQEAALGTDPDDPDSVFSITETASLPMSRKIQITWPSAPGVLYRIRESGDLDSWAVVRDWMYAQTPPADAFEIEASSSNGFFIIDAELP